MNLPLQMLLDADLREAQKSRKPRGQYIRTDEIKKKISLSKIGKKRKPFSEEWKRKLSEANKKHIDAPWIWKKGHKSWTEGIHLPKEIREKISKANSDKLVGEKNPSWKGGISPKKYVYFWRRLARKIREKDNFICKKCGAKEEKRKHCVHHIDFNKQNNELNNLITVCFNCHMKCHSKK